MSEVIILAAHRRNLNFSETKFCHGECQKEIDKKLFDKNGERICKQCRSNKNKLKYLAKKKEKENWGII